MQNTNPKIDTSESEKQINELKQSISKFTAKKFDELADGAQKFAKQVIQIAAAANSTNAVVAHTYNNAAESAQGWISAQNELNTAWETFQVLLGMPVIENLTPIIEEATKALADLCSNIDWAGFADTLGRTFDVLLPALNWILDNGALLASVLAGIAAAMAVLMLAIEVEKIEELMGSFRELFDLLKDHPALIIVSVIIGVITWLVTLYNTNEEFRNGVNAIWTGLVEFFSTIFSALGAFFTEMLPQFLTQAGEFIAAFVESVILFFTELPTNIGFIIGLLLGYFMSFMALLEEFITLILPQFVRGVGEWFFAIAPTVLQALGLAAQAVKDWVVGLIATAKTELPKFIAAVLQFFEQLPSKICDIGKNLVEGLWNGILSMGDWIKHMISEFASGIINGFKHGFQTRSPSKLTTAIGQNVGEGIGVGIEHSKHGVLQQTSAFSSSLLDTMRYEMAAQNAQVAQTAALPAQNQIAAMPEWPQPNYVSNPTPPQDVVVNLTAQLDGREIYRNQQKIAKNWGTPTSSVFAYEY